MPPLPNHPFIHYTPNFLPDSNDDSNDSTSADLFARIQTSAHPPWTTLSRRRVQSHPTRLTSKSVLLLLPAPAPAPAPAHAPAPAQAGFLPPHLARLVPGLPFVPNHVLVNEYLPGQGIMPHEDGPAYRPVVATVSLGSAAVVEFWPKDEGRGGKGEGGGGKGEGGGKVVRILMEVGSLLVTTGEGYTDYLHGIQETLVDEDLGPDTIANWDLLGDKGAFEGGRNVRSTRISLTYRDVIKVAKIGQVVFGKKR